MKSKMVIVLLLFFCSMLVCNDNKNMQANPQIFDVFSKMNVEMDVSNNSFVVTEKTVRIRSDASITSEIVGVVSKGDVGLFLEKKSNYQESAFSLFNWFKVTINGLEGWIYGEFIQLIDSKMVAEPYALHNSNDIWVITPKGSIYIGMNWSDFISIMGEGELIFEDADLKMKVYEYKEDGLLVDTFEGVDAITFIKITNEVCTLASGFKVGMTSSELIENGSNFSKNARHSSVYAPTYTDHSPSIALEFDSTETIVAMHLSLSGF